MAPKKKKDAKNLVNALYNILIEKDASLIEINPLVLNEKHKFISTLKYLIINRI